MTSNTGWRILITNPVLVATRAALEQSAMVTIAPDQSAETLRKAVGDADVIIVRTHLPADIFDNAPRVLGAVRHGVGLDFIPVDAATAKGIVVANVPGGNANSVAEYCVMQMMNLLRRPDRADSLMRAVGWEKARTETVRGREICGRVVGIIGFGAIGSRLAQILHYGFQVDVVVCTRRPELLPQWAKPVLIDALVSEADFVVPCVPYTKDTHHYLSAELISCLKPTAYVVNASRGSVIDELALLKALEERTIAGAALDVFEDKSPQPGHPVTRVKNLMITPHIAGNTVDAHTRIGMQCASEAIRILNGQQPQNFVNPEVWDRHQARRKELGGTRNLRH